MSTLFSCLQLFLFLSIAQAQPLSRQRIARDNSDGPEDVYINDPTSSNANANDYVEPPGPSSSMFPHFNIFVQIAIIGGAIMISMLSIIVVIFAYLRHRTKVEVKAERRRTALRMSMVAQQRASLERRRKSQMIIMEQLEKLRDEPENRPQLPMRASMMPGYGLNAGVLQAGTRSGRTINGRDDGWAVNQSDKFGLAPTIGIREMRLMDEDDDDELEKKSMFTANPQRRVGFI